MARTWFSVTVELLGGRGDELWPWPGRVFAVGPSHTFADLADAINDGFARWDRSHLSLFTLADSRLVTDEETGDELSSSPGGVVLSSLSIDKTVVARTLKPGDEFQYTFDLGDDWTHRCVIDDEKIDPVERLGIKPAKPLPYWGWGDIPDQHGRRWDGDDGQGRAPRRPQQRHPMLTNAWPQHEEARPLDMTEVSAAIRTGDTAAFLTALPGRDIDDVLQQVALGIPKALNDQRELTEPLALSIVNRLNMRASPGDRELADELLARLRGESVMGRSVPVELEQLIEVLRNSPSDGFGGGYLDLHTGEAILEALTDEGLVGDVAVDVEEEPDRWLPVPYIGSPVGWQDMADFAGRQDGTALGERLARAIEGRGAFRRFRDVIDEEGLVEQWRAFSYDRELGRAREFLAENDIQVGPATR